MGLRRVEKNDIRKIAKATGASVIGTLATAEGEEAFGKESLGTCEEVYEEAVGDNDFIFFKGMSK
jgi:T-complex protein 1 subunit alpha